jgi:hypothetical protein
MSKGMQDVTDLLDRAATCLRDLWNEYFYAGNDEMSSYPHELQDLFEEVGRRLFGALVLLPLDRLEFMTKYRAEPFPFLVVVPAAGRKPRLMVNRPSTDGNRYWDALVQAIGPNDVTVEFAEWFDWNIYGRREFEYYLGRIVAFPSRREFEGRAALIERKNTLVLFDSSAG